MTQMENLIFTQLSIPEIRQLFRQELETYFEGKNQNNPTLTENDGLLNIKQASEFLNLSVPTLYKYVQSARIPVNKVAGRLFFTQKELIEWVKSGRKKTLAEIELEANQYIQKKGLRYGR